LETMHTSFAAEREKLRIAMESHVDNMTKQFKAKLEASKAQASEEISLLQAAGKEKEEKLSTLVGKLKVLTAGASKMKDDNDGLKKRLESELTKQKSLQSQLEAAQKRVEEVAANGSATASSLLQRQETLEKEKIELMNRTKQMKDELSSKSNKVEELSGKLQALSSNMNVLTNDIRTKDEKLEMASKLDARLKTSEEEVARLRELVNKLKLEQMKNATLVEKLQSEKEANEQSQGERTAIVRMLEGQIADISEKLIDATAKLEAASYDVKQKEEDLQSATTELEKLTAQFDEINEEAKRSSEALALAQKGADAKSTKALEVVQKELQVTKQQMARKSAAAQRLLQQREAECAQLRKTTKDLQQEVDKGSYSDRKIFELAALQSNRESQQVSEIELRDSIIERLKQALLQRDGDLASAEKHAREIEGQIDELCRIQRREDVNLDYLKSIVVKYLSFPSGSTERTALLRVLATLLQFDDKDYKTIEAGKNKVSWWGGAVIPTMIAPSPKSGPATTGSAEVSVSTSSTTNSGKPATSLQF
jgi:chromosome segregation ATPase